MSYRDREDVVPELVQAIEDPKVSDVCVSRRYIGMAQVSLVADAIRRTTTLRSLHFSSSWKGKSPWPKQS